MFSVLCYLISLCVACVFCQYQECASCIVYNDCQEASRLMQQRGPGNDEKLRDALCGFKGKTPMVCCDKLTYLKIDLLPQECGYKEDKISPDSSTGLYDFPWMTLISYKNKQDGTSRFSCAGTIINSRYILTAAHCIQSPWNDTLEFVRIGEYNLDTKLDCVKDNFQECEHNVWDLKIEKKIVHEGYQKKMHDIGLLRLKTEIDLSLKNSKAICLPLTTKLRRLNITNMKGKIAGWGITDSGEKSSVLLSTDIPVLDNEECRRIFNARRKPANFIDMENKLCAGGKGQNACAGDSGVPLMISGRYHSNDRSDRWIQYGLVSFGGGCDGSTPDFYTDVSKHIDWILEKIEP